MIYLDLTDLFKNQLQEFKNNSKKLAEIQSEIVKYSREVKRAITRLKNSQLETEENKKNLEKLTEFLTIFRNLIKITRNQRNSLNLLSKYHSDPDFKQNYIEKQMIINRNPNNTYRKTNEFRAKNNQYQKDFVKKLKETNDEERLKRRREIMLAYYYRTKERKNNETE